MACCSCNKSYTNLFDLQNKKYTQKDFAEGLESDNESDEENSFDPKDFEEFFKAFSSKELNSSKKKLK